jgi:preprotein translocase subunit SecA
MKSWGILRARARIVARNKSRHDAIEQHRREFVARGADAVRGVADHHRQAPASSALDPALLGLAAASASLHLAQTPRPGQLDAANVLVSGGLVELPTGEGKTLAAALAAATLILNRRQVHVFTVNDYLARRDAEWMRPLYEGLGLTVASIAAADPDDVRRRAYTADIVYATHLQVGFDHLRDGLAANHNDIRVPAFDAVIVDEVDSILIDEARLPLVISGPGDPVGDLPYWAAMVVESLRSKEHFEVEQAQARVWLTDDGVDAVTSSLGVDLYRGHGGEVLRQINNALRARCLYRRDEHYVVKDGEVRLVDPYSGRTTAGRRWSEGLHQAIEAKERLELTVPRVTYAQMTVRSLVRLYTHVAGMSGTAQEAAREVRSVYGLETVVVAPNRPDVRVDHPDRFFDTISSKYDAVIDEVARRHSEGQPVLVGCSTVRACEALSARLVERGIRHETLHARDDEAEAVIIARAGTAGSVTVATHLAGRGVDIRLGQPGVDDQPARGLCVIGTERYESRRIERQLRGRSARQGDPGETIFFCSPEDPAVAPWVPRSSKLGIDTRLRIAQQNLEEWNKALREDLAAFDAVFELHRLTARRLRDLLLGDRAALADLDSRWVDHLQALHAVLDGIHLRAWGAVAPIAAWHTEAQRLLHAFVNGETDSVADDWASHLSLGPPVNVEDLGPKQAEELPTPQLRPPTARSVAAHQPEFGAGVLLDVIAVIDVDGGAAREQPVADE